MITRPCYSFREQAQRSIEWADGVDQAAIMDRALESAADNIDGQMHRIFYPYDATLFFDWPNWNFQAPWRLDLKRHEIVALTLLQSPGTGTPVTIPLNTVFLEPVNRRRGFPFTEIQLDRSSTSAFGAAPTPQHSIYATGTWGFTADADQVATLAANVATADTTITVSDGSKCGPGDVLILAYGRGAVPFPSAAGTAGAIAPYQGERMICSDRSFTATGLTQATGLTTANQGDQALTFTGSGAVNAGEVLLLDSERVLVMQVVAGTATVRRGWDGTTPAGHSGAVINAGRQLSVIRGELGTTAGGNPAAGYTSGSPVFRHRPPSLIRDLSIAEAYNQVLQEGAGYARTVGSGEAAMPAPGISLADKWDEAYQRFGRKARLEAI